MILPGVLTSDPDGYIHVTGHRIGLIDLVHYHNQGYSSALLLQQFPSLSMAVIEEVISYYLGNREEVDNYVADVLAEIELQRATTPQQIDWDSLRAQYKSRPPAEKR